MNKIGPGILLVAMCAALLPGCHRGYYRRQADAEAQALIRQKMNDPRWNQIDPTIDINPESRMHDPFSADHPPLPPDDPASHQLMEQVDCKRGYPHWHANGDTCYVENPIWQSYLPVNQQGVLELDIDTAVRLALLHSPDYQRQRETLYLSALDVSLERFGFDIQAFHGWEAVFNADREQSSFGINDPRGSGRTRLEKLGITGTQLIVGMANSIIWNFDGPSTQSASSLFDFSIVQPLLRGAGRDRILESLTQAERNLLADVRQMERFRRGFYLFVTTGRSAGAGPGGNFLSAPSGGISNAGGYLGLLQSQQEINIQEFRVRSLQNAVNQFREFFNEERVPLIQVTQTENQLLQAQTTLLRAKVDYENQLDAFKIDLGLPPDLPVVIKDPLLDQFQLIDEDFLGQQSTIIDVRDQIGSAMAAVNMATGDDANQPEDPNQQDEMDWSEELKQVIEGVKPLLESIGPLFKQIAEDNVAIIREDFQRLDSIRRERIDKFSRLRKQIEASEIEYEIEESVLDPSQIVSLQELEVGMQDVAATLQQLQLDAATLQQSIDDVLQRGPTMDKAELAKLVREDIVFEAPDLLTKLYNALVELTLLQARARTDIISLPNVSISDDQAIAIAFAFRRDLMNARAALVDQWRQIEFVADELESTLDLEFNGSVGSNDVNNLFRVRWETAQFGARLVFDAPITRLSERNQYRQILIQYQQSRRDFYSFQDEIKRNLRGTVRDLEQNSVLFELNRRSIKTSVQEVEQAQLDLIRPVRPGQAGIGQSFDSNASRNLTDALFNLQQAQNGFLGVYVNYEVARRGLDFDLGTMQLTPDGFWLDPEIIDASIALRAAEAYGLTPESLCLPPDALMSDPQQFEPAAPDAYFDESPPAVPPADGQAPNAARSRRPRPKSEYVPPAGSPLPLVRPVSSPPPDLSSNHPRTVWPEVVKTALQTAAAEPGQAEKSLKTAESIGGTNDGSQVVPASLGRVMNLPPLR